MNDSNPSGENTRKSAFRRGWNYFENILSSILYKLHLSKRQRIIINSVIIAFPAMMQYIFFSDQEYIISFFIYFTVVLTVFLTSRVRLIFSFPLVIASMIFSIYITIYHRSIGATAIIAIFNTRTEAIHGFIKSPKMITGMIALVIFLLLYIRVIMIGNRNEKKILVKGKSRIVLVGAVLVSLFVFLSMRENLMKAYPFSVLYDSRSYISIVSRMKDTAKKEYRFTGSLEPNFKNEVGNYILIVGETERRANCSLYGYGRKTNIFLQKIIGEHPRNFILFKDYTSTGQTTYPSLMSIFSVIPSKYFQKIPDYPSFTRILANISFKVYFVSTYNNIFQTFIGADQNIIINSDDDLSLINGALTNILNDRTIQKKFIIVHLRGSHLAFSNYNFKYSDYLSKGTDQIIEKYDNSIVHTSQMLSNIANIVISTDYPTCVWYMPDHGENLNDFGDNDYGHGEGGFTKYEIELPSVMFFNDSFSATNPELKRVMVNSMNKTSHSNVSHTFFGLVGIYPSEYLEELDLSSPNYRYDEPYLINSDLFPIRYSNSF